MVIPVTASSRGLPATSSTPGCTADTRSGGGYCPGGGGILKPYFGAIAKIFSTSSGPGGGGGADGSVAGVPISSNNQW